MPPIQRGLWEHHSANSAYVSHVCYPLFDMVSDISKYPDTQLTLFLYPAQYHYKHFQNGTTDGSHRILNYLHLWKKLIGGDRFARCPGTDVS